MKKSTKLLAVLLALVMGLACLAGCKAQKPNNAPGDKNNDKTYTFRTYTTLLGDCWNPHAWEEQSDNAILGYLETPLATMSIKDSENGIYQWVFKAATSVTDVTRDNKGDLDKYKVTLPAGKTSADINEGYVFEIKLNPDMKWENGAAINADTYIYSMKALLDPNMRNYRANLYYNGESAVAGGNTYYNSGAPLYDPMVPPYNEGEDGDYSFNLDKGIADGKVFINVTSDSMTLHSMSLAQLNSKYKMGFDAEVKALSNAANPYGYTPVTKDNVATVKKLVNGLLSGVFGITDPDKQASYLKEALWVDNGKFGELVAYDATVGCYKVDAYTIRYVTQAQIDYNYFLTSCTSNWLVYEDLYEKGKDTTGTLTTTKYGTSKDTTMSYGPYRIDSLQPGKQVVFVQNENYYEFKKQADGTLYAETDYLVDGRKVQAYQTTNIVVDVMTDEAAKLAFLKGQLTEWAPPADQAVNYATSQQMHKVDETYTNSFFFNSNVAMLQALDAKAGGNQNTVVLSNYNFRKAFSLAMNRADWVTATSGYKPAYALMNNLYHYDVYNDPNSSYRGSEAAMKAICELYGVQYGAGKHNATLKEAYQSINGYNLTEAKRLMKAACDELVAAGLYKAGEEIRIRVAYSGGELDSANMSQITKVNQYLNAAMAGSGFGKITLEAIGNIPSRHDRVPAGEYAIGYGAWGGAAFYPFRNMQVYCDTEEYDLNELGCWDPSTEELTINIKGEDVTMTWQDWSRALVGVGPYANADFDVKLHVTATMEREFLNKYYRIPLAGSCASFLLSYQVKYYTEDYNIMYGFGGMELMTYNYSDAQWEEHVRKAGGQLSYE